MTVLSMSRMEIDRVHVLRDLLAERIRTREAAQLMGVMTRQVFRLLRAYHAGGPAALISKKRGKLSNRSYPHGKPIAFYSDKHATFRVNKVGATGGDGMTQFGRALHELNIDIICANIPQAKGRVERANGTLQDRLVKEMRLAGVSTIEAGNAFLSAFMEDYNRHFAKLPFNDKDLHRPLAAHDDIEDAFAWKEARTVSFNLTLQYDKVLFMLEPNETTRPLARQRVTIYDYPDGHFAIKHQGRSLPYKVFDKLQQVDQAAIVENKRLGQILAMIAEQQKQMDMKRSNKAPRRRGQGQSMFKVG
ncbi:helix-turn-helix domain-containing protein [Labrys sp. KB_33_2]|uniref:helix-turn-helix domain-containing protein n=1 Tax=Labrys sp. KB_33_2 TaxID=3237479 RepID=UPI003F93A3C0